MDGCLIVLAVVNVIVFVYGIVRSKTAFSLAGWTQGNPEAKVVVFQRGRILEAIGRSADPGLILPGAAAVYALVGRCRSLRVDRTPGRVVG